jgi:UDP-N-acetylmuramate: L-alanyl-gamma-D-glutamyl-meso-diaminopimelate ligase
MVMDGFGGNIVVANETHEVLEFIQKELNSNSVLLMMSSGNFDGIDYEVLGEEIIEKW